MIGKLLGREVPATGFSIGFERVVGILQDRAVGGGEAEDRVALVFDQDTPHLRAILAQARELREKGSVVLLELRSRRLGKQLQDLETRGFRIAVVNPDGRLEWRPARGTGD
jgi:histidyl-tRNA synthetase